MVFFKRVRVFLKQKYEELTWFGRIIWVLFCAGILLATPWLVTFINWMVTGTLVVRNDSIPVALGTIAFYITLFTCVVMLLGISRGHLLIRETSQKS